MMIITTIMKMQAQQWDQKVENRHNLIRATARITRRRRVYLATNIAIALLALLAH